MGQSRFEISSLDVDAWIRTIRTVPTDEIHKALVVSLLGMAVSEPLDNVLPLLKEKLTDYSTVMNLIIQLQSIFLYRMPVKDRAEFSLAINIIALQTASVREINSAAFMKDNS